eukprot:Cvel_25362.t1-p1 / transcript=Cvel_25362.t1 / gene=Cvel_25362 / organism=Chromera_velia_CCMP2878 / gene_product=hypothetical protein / transcript_product=hypothetical protein / location=Cvel_scaffold2863:458-3915(-) / protein_length=408 / sequence_SO=supercontig / SO=protein_coding / is_pseudo=false
MRWALICGGVLSCIPAAHAFVPSAAGILKSLSAQGERRGGAPWRLPSPSPSPLVLWDFPGGSPGGAGGELRLGILEEPREGEQSVDVGGGGANATAAGGDGNESVGGEEDGDVISQYGGLTLRRVNETETEDSGKALPFMYQLQTSDLGSRVEQAFKGDERELEKDMYEREISKTGELNRDFKNAEEFYERSLKMRGWTDDQIRLPDYDELPDELLDTELSEKLREVRRDERAREEAARRKSKVAKWQKQLSKALKSPLLLATLVLVLFARTFIFEPVYSQTTLLEPLIPSGALLIVAKAASGGGMKEVQSGDLMWYKQPEYVRSFLSRQVEETTARNPGVPVEEVRKTILNAAGGNKFAIQRVFAKEGDVIEARLGKLTVNGEDKTADLAVPPNPATVNFGPLTVPN